jgi:atypical dual specificity phosphatase
MQHTLIINNLCLGYGDEEIIRIDNLQLEKSTIIGLLGPSGGGKSSLVKSILKQNSAPSFWKKGDIYLENQIITNKIVRTSIGYVPQKARLYTGTIIENFIDGIPFKASILFTMKKKFAEKIFKSLGLWYKFEHIMDEPAIKQSMGIHKILLIVRTMIVKPKLLILDEILADTSIKDESIIIDLIKKLKKVTTVFLITHNKDEAKYICDSIVLISGGILHEHTKSEQFFSQPDSDIGQEFLMNGSAWYTNPNIDSQPKEDKLTALRRFSSMSDFFWIIPDKLGGMQKPGLMTDLKSDLSIMKQLGVNVLVSLQQKPIDIELLDKFEIKGIHFPIVDMQIPSVEDVFQFFNQLKPLLLNDISVVYHCKAGMGRTGTMLACHLIWHQKMSTIKAIDVIRQINHKYIQTSQQLDFVNQFESYLSNM